DTDRPVLAVERHGQNGAVRARVHAVSEIVVVDDVGIAQDLVGPDGPARLDGARGQARAWRLDVARRMGAVTTPGDGDEAPVGLKETKTGRAHAEKREHAVDGALAEGGDFEAFGERRGPPAQLLGFPPALLRLLVQARILERDRGLGGEVAERSELLLAERVGRLAEPEHADDAEQPV